MLLLKCRFRGLFTLRNGYNWRHYATGSGHDPSKIRNMALVAHIDSGKTTLTESILLKSSYISSPGTVDTGSTTTDFLPVERERGITVQSASIPVLWKEWTFNLIDTPGHADFGMEVESASRVVDGAVVLIDSVEGVESQTKGVWRQLDRYGVRSRLIFLNKLDRPGASFKASLASLLTNRLHPNPMTLTIPIASFDPQHYAEGEPGIQGVVDLVRWNLWKWDDQGQASCRPLPRSIEDLEKDGPFPSNHPIIPHLVIARTQILENLSMVSEDFMETLLAMPSEPSAYLKLNSESIMPHLRKASLSNQVLPVLCGSAMKNIGTDLVMDYIGELLPSPLDVTHEIQGQNPPVKILAWKVNWDDRKGWMTFVRVYSGKLTRQINLLNTNRNQKEKMSKILLLYASEAEEVDELPFGSVGVILGLKYTRTGDTLISAGASELARSLLRDITPPPALISASVIPHSHSDLQPVQDALASLSRTDPSLRVDVQDGQILVHGLGALHLEIVEGRLRDEWRVNFEFGRRRVSYREGLGLGFKEPALNWNLWEGDVGGKHITTKIPIQIRSMEPTEEGDPVWDGNIVVDEKGTPIPIPQSMPGSLLAYVAEGISNSLSNSPHSSLPMTHVHIQVGRLKELTTRVSSIVTGATATILRRRFRDAGMGPILEPFVALKISVSESSLGKVVKDLTEHNGEVVQLSESTNVGPSGQGDIGGFSEEGVYIPPEWLSPSGSHTSRVISYGSRIKRSLQGIAPLSQFLDYSNRLRAMSEGHGVFEMTNAGFKQVSQERKMEILREIGRA